jgi:alpha-1,6-mannosyltransferase
MKILQAANFVAPTSGGLRTTLYALARGYRAAGHEVTQVIPAARDADERTPDGRVIALAAPRIPGFGGYRMIPAGRRLEDLLDAVRPDRIEVSDRLSLQMLGRWGRRHGVPTVVISHERLDAVLSLYLPGTRLSRAAADWWNRRLVDAFDTVVCTTGWARQEFDRIDAPRLAQVPLGVDLQLFHPRMASPALRRTLSADGAPLLVMASRLSPEKQPELAIEALRTLRRRGVRARMIVAGSGPAQPACERAAADLPVVFLGFVADRARLAQLLATADVVLAPGPVETFGLSALEALASGTPVVGRRSGALPELLDHEAGRTAYGHPASFAGGVGDLLDRDQAQLRGAARAHAERFDWSATVEGMLSVHGLAVERAA